MCGPAEILVREYRLNHHSAHSTGNTNLCLAASHSKFANGHAGRAPCNSRAACRSAYFATHKSEAGIDELGCVSVLSPAHCAGLFWYRSLLHRRLSPSKLRMQLVPRMRQLWHCTTSAQSERRSILHYAFECCAKNIIPHASRHPKVTILRVMVM